MPFSLLSPLVQAASTVESFCPVTPLCYSYVPKRLPLPSHALGAQPCQLILPGICPSLLPNKDFCNLLCYVKTSQANTCFLKRRRRRATFQQRIRSNEVEYFPQGSSRLFLVILPFPIVSQPIPLSPPPMIHGTIPSRAVAQDSCYCYCLGADQNKDRGIGLS